MTLPVFVSLEYFETDDGIRIVRNTSTITLEVARANGTTVEFPPTAVATLERGDTVRTPPGEDAGKPRPVSDREIMFAKRISAALRGDDADYLWAQRLPDGRAVFLLPWSGAGHQLSIGRLDSRVYTDTWNYHPGHADAAWRAALSWDGHGEPEGWTRHPSSGRVRPDGTAASEVIER